MEGVKIVEDFSAKIIRLNNGCIPFGSIIHFLNSEMGNNFLASISDNVEQCIDDTEIELSPEVPNLKIAKSVRFLPSVKTTASPVKSYKEANLGNNVKVPPNFDHSSEGSSVPIFSRTFYNSSFEESNNSPIKISSSKSVCFTPPKNLGKQKHVVNFALNPVGYQFDPLQEIFPESNVEYGLDSFYKLESIGIKDEDSSSYDDRQVDKFSESISLRDNHYYVKLPWKEDLINQVPSNLKVSLAVAERVYSKLENQGIVDDYEEVFNNQESLGIIEPVDKRSSGQIWIPHRPVIKCDEHTTTKIRPVFNCSLKIGKSPSLNEAAFPGVDLMNNLLSLLLYFRTNNCVLLADIAKAFLQIRLSSEDDKNRFCFFRKINGRFVPYRYNTIIFGFVSSPFILNYIVQHHLANSQSSAASLIRDKFYVDNLIFTSNQIESMPQFVEEVKQVMLAGGLPLREWGSNIPSTLFSLNEEEKTPSNEMKVLGYLYNSEHDSLQLKNNLLNESACTKRQILSSLASIFDPIGIFNPILLQGKLILRLLCQQASDWDQQVSPEILQLWSKFCVNFKEVSHASFARKSFDADHPVKLFLFADASKEAYGCAIYAVQHNVSSLLFSKTKVSPLKERTLPTLELLASLLALKCCCSIFESGLLSGINIEDITLFIDSQVVLSWILTNKAPRKNVFVNNRLKDISGLLDSIKIKFVQVSLAYVPSLHNQADFVTKPCSSKHFLENFVSWVVGPHWLVLPPREWPKGQLGCIPHSAKGELITPVLGPAKTDALVDICKYSSFSKLIGVTTKLFTAVFKFKKSLADPVEAATNYLIKVMQHETFDLEISYLQNPNSMAEVPKLVSQLNLFLDEQGILRSKGRIDKNMELKYHVVNPVVMSKHHHLTKLVIYYAHCKTMHMGLQSVLNFLRMHGMWVLKARQAVLSVIKDCVVCKRYNARSIKYPSPPSLPASRVNLSVPFAHTGVDYTGHIWLRGRGDEKIKVYILIFTCFNTRAIHLEAVESMTTAEFILAFVRFVNRYGLPSAVYSDNAKSFVQAGGIIEQLLSSSEFEEKFRIASIAHRTIPIYAAWYGATWERLIKTVKQCLYKTLGRVTPSYPEFITFLSDIQKVLNNRPLTYRSCENEIDIISPNHFLVGGPIPSIMFGDKDQVPEWEELDDENYSSLLAQKLELRDALFVEFKDRWLREYLVNLREKDRAAHHSQRDWKIGEIALLKLASKSRPHWPLVRVVDIFPSDEGIIRTIRVVKSDNSEVTVNVSHLIPLELYSELNNPNLYNAADHFDENEDDLVDNFEFSDTEEVPDPVSARPSRKTAEASRAQIRSLAGKGLV